MVYEENWAMLGQWSSPLSLQYDKVFLFLKEGVGERMGKIPPILSYPAGEWKLPLSIETWGEEDKHVIPQESCMSLNDSLACSEPQFPHQ